MERTVWTTLPEQDCQDKGARTGLRRQDCKDKTARAGSKGNMDFGGIG
jgi:hypothetical protein